MINLIPPGLEEIMFSLAVEERNLFQPKLMNPTMIVPNSALKEDAYEKMVGRLPEPPKEEHHDR